MVYEVIQTKNFLNNSDGSLPYILTIHLQRDDVFIGHHYIITGETEEYANKVDGKQSFIDDNKHTLRTW